MVAELTVIGTGFMGENHAHAIRDHPELTLQSVVDVDRQRAETVAERYGAEVALTDHETALERADAAVVATPEAVHAEQALSALDREVHLLLEKPITDEVASARALSERARDADVVTATGFLLRYDTAYAKACQTAREGGFGDVVGARVKRTITVSEVDRLGDRAHPLFYTSIHDIDLLHYALGERVTTVSAVERRGSHNVDIPDAFQALLTFESGTIATVEGYSVLPADAPETPDAALELTGTNGYATVESPGDGLTVHTDRFDRPDTRHWPVIDGRVRGAVRAQMDRFADAIAGRDEMAATIEDGYRAQVVAQTIKDAIEVDGPREVDEGY